MRKLLILILSKLLLADAPLRGSMKEEQYILALSKAYQNPAIDQYLREREVYLIYAGMDKFVKGNLDGAKGLAGQLIEIRALRTRMKACYTRTHHGSIKKAGANL